MKRIALVVLFALAGPAWADPPALDIPAEVTPTGDYAVMTPKTDAVSVLYVALSGVSPFPSEMLKDSRSFVLPVRGLAGGSYSFAAVAASKTGEQARKDFTVTIAGPPKPPDPPTPPPVPPTDPLVVSLSAAYASDADADKPALKAGFVAFYKAAADTAKNAPDVATFGDLFTKMANAAVTLGLAGKMPKLQAAVSVELRANLPTDRTAPIDRAKASATFTRIAAALEAVK